MMKSIRKWVLITLLTVGSLFALNAIRVDLLTLSLWVLDDPIATASFTVTNSQIQSIATSSSDQELHSAQTVSLAATGKLDTSEAESNRTPFYVPGEFVELLPASPATIAMPGVIKGTVKLSNPHGYFWRVTIEGTVVLANGMTHQVMTPRTLWMVPNQTLQRPVQLPVDLTHFVPGVTQFLAVLKDDQGKIIDQASVSFTLTVDFP